MLIIDNHKGSFKVRVAGVMQQENRILLLNEPLAGEYWFLPGGRAEMHESTDETLTRELEEEMQVKPRIGTLLWVIENFYTIHQIPNHTIGFYYRVDLPENHPLSYEAEYFSEREEDGVMKKFHFRWCSPYEIESMDIRPPCLKEMLKNINSFSQPYHCVIRERST